MHLNFPKRYGLCNKKEFLKCGYFLIIRYIYASVSLLEKHCFEYWVLTKLVIILLCSLTSTVSCRYLFLFLFLIWCAFVLFVRGWRDRKLEFISVCWEVRLCTSYFFLGWNWSQCWWNSICCHRLWSLSSIASCSLDQLSRALS